LQAIPNVSWRPTVSSISVRSLLPSSSKIPCPGSGKSPSTSARVTVVEIPRPRRSRWKARKSET
jgi:hypothetical protein